MRQKQDLAMRVTARFSYGSSGGRDLICGYITYFFLPDCICQPGSSYARKPEKRQT
jgi:hypothetical protein